MTTPDEFQKKAIVSNGNILLIAGAGAGKTFTIIGKINYLIENKIYEDKDILIISFTNKSVDDLKRKLKYNIDVLTFHKLAMNILIDHNITFNIASDNTLKYITEEFFYSLSSPTLKRELLNYYKEYDYNIFLKSNKFNNLIKIITTFIKLFKTNDININEFNKIYKLDKTLSKFILIILKIYSEELSSNNYLDFDDIIKKATLTLKSFYKYKYIIIDEFQDTSLLRWNLINKLLKLNQATIFAVGDDFQSIYHFSGCNINLFLNLKEYIPDLKILKLKYTYRNSQELINIASKFILKNKKQISKDLISHKHLKEPIKYIYYYNPKKALKNLLDKLLTINDDILILGRNNKDIDEYINKEYVKENDFLIYKNKKIKYLTVHSSKGLEANYVIIINLTNKIMGFPNKIINNKLINIINSNQDNFLYAEERRLFYVALTRTKNEVFLLTPFLKKSEFIKELRKIKS